MIQYSRHAKHNMKLYNISESDVEKVIEESLSLLQENDRFVVIKHLQNKFKNKPLKVVYKIENERKFIISTYPLNNYKEENSNESKL